MAARRYWSMGDIAAELHLSAGSIRAMRKRGEHEFPPPDVWIGREDRTEGRPVPGWRETTARRWIAHYRGKR